jgi:hypothetical protein
MQAIGEIRLIELAKTFIARILRFVEQEQICDTRANDLLIRVCELIVGALLMFA